MQLIVSGKNFEVSDRLKDYVEKKVGKLDRYLPTLTEARVELTLENTKNIAQSQVVQVTLRNNGTILRGEERSSDFTAAVDTVLEKLYKQIDRYKGKRQRARTMAGHEAVEGAEETEVEGPRVVRTKRFRTTPMSEEEAIEQMELLGHSFFLFFNRDRGALNLVYRRNDGNYGLIEPETV
ncbi:MAG: ribosome-associated translation inhibitor RaiA [Chloroflexi bacterium]|nr:ribosome-associated translation inhibitor RaiA [Chloroflexota bacterium]